MADEKGGVKIPAAFEKTIAYAKKNPLIVGGVAAGILGLIALLNRNKEEQTYTPVVGLAGYPENIGGGGSSSDMGGGGSSSDMGGGGSDIWEAINDALNQQQTQFDKEKETYSNQYNAMYEQMTSIATQQEITSQAAERQNIIRSMEQNSYAWAGSTSQTERDNLSAANRALGTSLGLSFDDRSGLWLDNGVPVYVPMVTPISISGGLTPAKVSTNTGTTNRDFTAEINKAIADGANVVSIDALGMARNTKTGGQVATAGNKVNYDKGVDYAGLLQQYKAAGGTSQTIIKTLEAQRVAKIAGENLNNDGTKKTSSGGGSSISGSSSSGGGSSSSSKTTSGSTSVSYDKNTDYAAAINAAKAAGQSTTKLEAQRAAKIAGEKLNNDGTKKK